jgi:chromosome segregation ATPase
VQSASAADIVGCSTSELEAQLSKVHSELAHTKGRVQSLSALLKKAHAERKQATDHVADLQTAVEQQKKACNACQTRLTRVQSNLSEVWSQCLRVDLWLAVCSVPGQLPLQLAIRLHRHPCTNLSAESL